MHAATNSFFHLPAPLSPFAADTRKVRDACVVEKGQEQCAASIEAHKVCLRADGFDVQ